MSTKGMSSGGASGQSSSLYIGEWNEPPHDPNLEEQIIEKLLKAYPNLKLGERMIGVIGVATPDGVMIQEAIWPVDETHTAIISGIVGLNHPLDESITIQGLEVTKYIHPHRTTLLHGTVQFRFGVSGLPIVSKDVAVDRQTLKSIKKSIEEANSHLRSLRREDNRFTTVDHNRLDSIEKTLRDCQKSFEDLLKVDPRYYRDL